jgi:predicted transcriptional regulator
MSKIKVIQEPTEDFFKRGREIARQADSSGPVVTSLMISFEDPRDITRLLSTAKLTLLATVRNAPASITDLAKTLHRDRSAVKRDVSDLVSIGVLSVRDVPHPGHGIKKEVSATSQKIQFSF